MISDSRSAGSRRTVGPEVSDLPALITLISRGSVPAFVALFDRTSAAVCAELAAHVPDGTRHSQILAASYLEVWWLAGCHRAPDSDVSTWITGIVRRRVVEASRDVTRTGEHADLPQPRPSYAELEVSALLRRPVGDLLRA